MRDSKIEKEKHNFLNKNVSYNYKKTSSTRNGKVVQNINQL